jgi:Calx-beta domain.
MRKNVLHLLLLSLVALVSFACSDKEIEKVTISLENENYILPKEGTLQVKLRASEPIVGQLSVPYTVTGTAVKDKDYSISANSFVFNAGSKEAVVTITANGTYEPDKTITITLGDVQDKKYEFQNKLANIKLEHKETLTYSFMSRKYVLTKGLDVELNLLTADGSRYIASEDITIDVELDEAKTTAVEGVNFKFEEGKTIVVKKGESKGVVKLTLITKEDNKDVIVLKVKEREGLVAGNYASTKNNYNG